MYFTCMASRPFQNRLVFLSPASSPHSDERSTLQHASLPVSGHHCVNKCLASAIGNISILQRRLPACLSVCLSCLILSCLSLPSGRIGVESGGQNWVSRCAALTSYAWGQPRRHHQPQVTLRQSSQPQRRQQGAAKAPGLTARVHLRGRPLFACSCFCFATNRRAPRRLGAIALFSFPLRPLLSPESRLRSSRRTTSPNIAPFFNSPPKSSRFGIVGLRPVFDSQTLKTLISDFQSSSCSKLISEASVSQTHGQPGACRELSSTNHNYRQSFNLVRRRKSPCRTATLHFHFWAISTGSQSST